MIHIFIGYDQREAEAAHVLHHSIMRQSSMPVSVTLLNRETLRGIFTRPRGPLDSTDFSISRFLAPYLCDYIGWSIFMDCDMLCRDDIAKLWAWRNDKYAVRVVKHNYVPKQATKFLGETQTRYPYKNWSSVMLMNNERCGNLTLDYVNTAPGLQLHQFSWTEKDLIGEIPRHWNHLVGYYDNDERAALAHYTDGGPYFTETENCDYGDEWFAECARSKYIESK